MNNNVGKVDRIIRALLGLLVIALGVMYQSWWGAVGVIFLLTAAIRWCPAYAPFGISTRRKGADSSS